MHFTAGLCDGISRLPDVFIPQLPEQIRGSYRSAGGGFAVQRQPALLKLAWRSSKSCQSITQCVARCSLHGASVRSTNRPGTAE